MLETPWVGQAKPNKWVDNNIIIGAAPAESVKVWIQATIWAKGWIIIAWSQREISLIWELRKFPICQLSVFHQEGFRCCRKTIRDRWSRRRVLWLNWIHWSESTLFRGKIGEISVRTKKVSRQDRGSRGRIQLLIKEKWLIQFLQILNAISNKTMPLEDKITQSI